MKQLSTLLSFSLILSSAYFIQASLNKEIQQQKIASPSAGGGGEMFNGLLLNRQDPVGKSLPGVGLFTPNEKYHKKAYVSKNNIPVILLEHKAHITVKIILQDLQKTLDSLTKKRSYNNITGTCDSTAANCAFDMTGYIFDSNRVVKSGKVSYAKNVTPIPNYYDVSYSGDNIEPGFDDFEDNFTCTNIDSCTDDADQLSYYAYYISGINYDSCKFPAILLSHAGGFSDCSNLNYEDVLCRSLARKGFVVFNIEYRRGRIKSPLSYQGITSAQQLLANYRAIQDLRGAYRSIIKRQARIAYNHFPYQIDTNRLFVIGQSAGGLGAAGAIYYPSQAMIDSIFKVPPGELPISSALGPINADFYYGDTTINYLSHIQGFCSMWGGFAIPKVVSDSAREYDFLTQNGTYILKPMIGFMGKLDPVFPFQEIRQNRFYPNIDDSIYTTENWCLINIPFIVHADGKQNPNPDYRIECSNNLYKILKSNGIPTLMYIDSTMKHGLGKICDTCTCYTNFGATWACTKDQVNEYLAARTCFFFQAIMNGTAGGLLGIQKFVNCEDKRTSQGACAVAANNNCQ